MEVIDALKGRQSVKNYLSTPVETEKLNRILEAGRLAPSAYNHQYRRFIVVTDPALKKEIREKAGTQPMVEQAPALIVYCATEDIDFTMPNGEKPYPIDAGICGGYMMLEAYDQGLGACWLGVFDPEAVKEVLNLPEEVKVVTMIPIGYHDGTQERKPRKPLEETVSYHKY